jgi:hypothetical protein
LEKVCGAAPWTRSIRSQKSASKIDTDDLPEPIKRKRSSLVFAMIMGLRGQQDGQKHTLGLVFDLIYRSL